MFAAANLCVTSAIPIILQRADSYDFDPMDVTKTWPEDLFPLQPVGRMVLNRWVEGAAWGYGGWHCSLCLGAATFWHPCAHAHCCCLFEQWGGQEGRLTRWRTHAALAPNMPVCKHSSRSNPDNFFNENEQLAFCPALVVPGEHIALPLP